MIYLDNAATGLVKPAQVTEAAGAAMALAANPGRSGHKLSLSCMEQVVACRGLLSGFLGGYGAEFTVFTKNCTEALNIAIFGGLGGAGEKIVATVAEHNSVLRPLEALKKRGTEVVYVPLDSGGEIDLNALERAVNTGKRPKAAVVTLASNVTGAVTDIAAVKKLLPRGCVLVCDGAQACGHVEVNMKKCGIDALALAGHKGMLGIQGSGALLFSPKFRPAPILYGGTGTESYNLDMPATYPDCLEAGTLNYPAIISLAEGVNYLKAHMREHQMVMAEFTRAAIAGLKEIAGVEVYSKPNPCGIVAFALENMQSEMAAYALSEEFDIYVRGGLHCAPLMHKALGSEGLVRASFSPFTPKNAVEELTNAVRRLAGRGAG